MTSTFADRDRNASWVKDFHDRVILGRHGKDMPPAANPSFQWLAPAGGMWSSANDIVKLGQAIISAYHRNFSLLYDQTPKRNHIRDSFRPRILNTDGSGFGSPWEQDQVEGNQVSWIRYSSKAGFIPGYSTVLSLQPEMRSGFVLLYNEGVDASRVAKRVWSEIAKPLNETLFETQQREESSMNHLPPKNIVDRVVGHYAPFSVQKSTDGKRLVFGYDPMPNSTVLMEYRNGYTFQLKDEGQQSCIMKQLLAQEGSWVKFENILNGTASTAVVAGLPYKKG
jgi:hypothetical protein